MPKSLADGRLKVTFLAVKPTNVAAMTVAQANAGVDFSCAIVASDFRLSPTDSDRVDDKALCDEGNVKAIGASNYEANMSFFRYINATTGASDGANDIAFTTFTAKGVTGYWAKRWGAKSTVAWAAGDVYDLFEVTADNPQDPQDLAGYVKFRQPFEVGGVVALRGVVV